MQLLAPILVLAFVALCLTTGLAVIAFAHRGCGERVPTLAYFMAGVVTAGLIGCGALAIWFVRNPPPVMLF